MRPDPDALSRVAAALAADPTVSAVYLGGSRARGEDDAYSDIDLAIRASHWTPERLGALWLAGSGSMLGGRPFFHGMLHDGTILDALVVAEPPSEGYRPLELPDPEPAPPGSTEPGGAAAEFWLNSAKHRKVFGRGLWPMATFGVHHDRLALLRMWAQLDMGEDPKERAMTIFGMTPLVRQHLDDRRQAILGMPTRTALETAVAIVALRGEVAQTGRATEARWGVPYPYRLEAIVHRIAAFGPEGAMP